LRRIVDDACGSQGTELNVVAGIESLPSVKRAVEAGLGFTILPLGAVADEVTAGRLRGASRRRWTPPRISRLVLCVTCSGLAAVFGQPFGNSEQLFVRYYLRHHFHCSAVSASIMPPEKDSSDAGDQPTP
jgi:hypothetical protein